MAATPSGAQSARIPLSEYRTRLRELFGAGNFRISKAGSIHVNGGGWTRWGRVGSDETIRLLFPRERGVVAVEFALIMAIVVVALVAGCTKVDNAIRARWPGVTLAQVAVELVDMAAERIGERTAPPEVEQ